jgi:DNA-binding beta-propeller fold protein YncE
MSNIRVNAITDEAGTGAPDFPNGYTVAGAVPAAGFSYAAVSGATQALDVGAHNFFDAGTLTADTTISFTNVPTEAQWTYTAKAGISEGYTLGGGAAYASLSKNVISQDTSPCDVKFSPDGTKMYVLGLANTSVYQYTLGTAWDVSTATYASLSKSVVAQDTGPYGLTFSPDGTKMYIVGITTDTVYQYTLGTAWNVSTATYASLSKSVVAQDTYPAGIAFSPDGTKMFMVGRFNQNVSQYTLSTAWNVSTATYASLSKNVISQEADPFAVEFSSDGTRMFIVGRTSDTVYQYTLGTAWNVSTATYASLSKSVAAQGGSPFGLAFSSDGSKMYTVDSVNTSVYQYNTAIATTLTTPASIQNYPTAAYFSDDQLTYTFVTADAGTTVKLINEQVL